MEPLQQLVSKLETSFSGRLVSVILYGSAAAPGQTDRFSDLNVLCVLKDITPKELADGEPILGWWREQGNPAPLLMTEQEVSSSADSFPIEFHDMKRNRRVLFGTDPIAGLTVEDTHYRAQLEHQLRAGLLRLRQQGAGVLSNPVELLKLCADSVTTFCVLGRHALQVTGTRVAATQDRRALVSQLSGHLGTDLQPFLTLLDVRESKTVPPNTDAADLFAQYLVCVAALIAFVDQAFETKSHKSH